MSDLGKPDTSSIQALFSVPLVSIILLVKRDLIVLSFARYVFVTTIPDHRVLLMPNYFKTGHSDVTYTVTQFLEKINMNAVLKVFSNSNFGNVQLIINLYSKLQKQALHALSLYSDLLGGQSQAF